LLPVLLPVSQRADRHMVASGEFSLRDAQSLAHRARNRRSCLGLTEDRCRVRIIGDRKESRKCMAFSTNALGTPRAARRQAGGTSRSQPLISLLSPNNAHPEATTRPRDRKAGYRSPAVIPTNNTSCLAALILPSPSDMSRFSLPVKKIQRCRPVCTASRACAVMNGTLERDHAVAETRTCRPFRCAA
jgi:hypothetical protein